MSMFDYAVGTAVGLTRFAADVVVEGVTLADEWLCGLHEEEAPKPRQRKPAKKPRKKPARIKAKGTKKRRRYTRDDDDDSGGSSPRSSSQPASSGGSWFGSGSSSTKDDDDFCQGAANDLWG